MMTDRKNDQLLREIDRAFRMTLFIVPILLFVLMAVVNSCKIHESACGMCGDRTEEPLTPYRFMDRCVYACPSCETALNAFILKRCASHGDAVSGRMEEREDD